jgi:hypothetical protein
VAVDPVALVRRYDEVWNERDGDRRLEILGEIWADDGLYVDPDVPEGLRGREALSDFIAASFKEMPGLSVAALTDLAVLGDRAWYRWRATADGAPDVDGTDFVEFAADGRIQRLTGFYD